jgi:hypothetical protein
MVTEPPHGLRLPAHPQEPTLVEAVDLHRGDGDLPVQSGVVGEVDPLASSLAEESPDLVPTAGKGDGEFNRYRWWWRGRIAGNGRGAVL